MQQTATHYITTCPKCLHRNPKLYTDKQSGAFYCFHCNYKGFKMYSVASQPTPKIDLKYVTNCAKALFTTQGSSALQYLVQKRGLAPSILKEYSVGYEPHLRIGDKDVEAVVLPEIRNGSVLNCEYRILNPTEAIPRYMAYGQRSLFNIDKALALGKTTCVITEGRIDALSAIQLKEGVPVIGLPAKDISNKIDLTPLDKFKQLYFAVDQTVESEDSLDKLIERFPLHKCYRVKYPAKDVNELLLQSTSKDLWGIALATPAKIGKSLLTTLQESSEDTFKFLKGHKASCYSTGFPALDAITGGVRAGELTILSGSTGVGKTTLSTALAFNLAKQGVKVLIGSFEVPFQTYIIPKLLSFFIGKNIHNLTGLTYEEYLKMSASFISQIPIQGINRVGATTLEEIELAIKLAYAEGYRFVILDHLHYFIQPGENEREHIEQAMIKLQRLVKRTYPDLGVLLITHPRKFVGTMNSMDLRGSVRISQDADNIWLLPKAEDGRIYLKVDKLRSDLTNTPAGGVVLVQFNKDSFHYNLLPMESLVLPTYDNKNSYHQAVRLDR